MGKRDEHAQGGHGQEGGGGSSSSTSHNNRPSRPLSIQSPGGSASTFEVHVTPGPASTRGADGKATAACFTFQNNKSNPSLLDGCSNSSSGAGGGGGGGNGGGSGSKSGKKALKKKYSRSNSKSLGMSSSKGRGGSSNATSDTLSTSGQMRQRAAQLGLLGRSARTVKRLWRPFGLVHHIVGDDEEMKRHPSLMHRAPTARVTRFFLWRKWTIIVIILQMYIQVGVDIRNFSIFMSDPYESLCPCRATVDAREASEASASRAAQESFATRSALALASVMATAKGSPMSAARYAAQAQYLGSKDLEEGEEHDGHGAFTDVHAALFHGGNQVIAAQEEEAMWNSVLFDAHGDMEHVHTAAMADRRRRLQQQQQQQAGTVPVNGTANGGGGDKAAAVEEDVNQGCEICDSVASVAATGRLPSCYNYYASPGFNQVIRPPISASNEGKIGLLAFRTVNSTKPISLVYLCNGTTEMGRKSTTCFQDDKILIKRNCSLGFYATEYVKLEMSALLARIKYAPQMTMRWSDCDPSTHTQIRDKVCLADGKVVALGYCEAAGLTPPIIERECCLGQEDIYDTVYNKDYNNIMIFFDVVALVVSFSRLISMHMAWYFIDSYKMSTIFVMWTWGVPFLGAFLKYSYPLNGFVSEAGREGAIEFMTGLTGAEYLNNTALNQIMSDALQQSGGYDPIMLYLMNLIDALRSYAVYGQAFSLVSIEFYYRFIYALMVLGELGPLAISVLPGFRSAAVVLKTLLPESATLGWMVSVGPMMYMPFLACVLAMFIQVFSDYWFTLSAMFYSFSNIAMIVFYWRNSSIYMDPVSFRKQLNRQDMIRNALLALSFAFAMVFMVESSRKESQGAGATMRTIGPQGFLSFIVRCIFNFQLASVFSADVVLYLLRRLQRQARADRLTNMEYERALKEFRVLDDPKDQELEARGDSIDVSASASAALASMGRKTMMEMAASGGAGAAGKNKKIIQEDEGWKSVERVLAYEEEEDDEEQRTSFPASSAATASMGVALDGGGGNGGAGGSSSNPILAQVGGGSKQQQQRPLSVSFTPSSPTLLQTNSSTSSSGSTPPQKGSSSMTTPLRRKQGP